MQKRRLKRIEHQGSDRDSGGIKINGGRTKPRGRQVHTMKEKSNALRVKGDARHARHVNVEIRNQGESNSKKQRKEGRKKENQLNIRNESLIKRSQKGEAEQHKKRRNEKNIEERGFRRRASTDR